MELATGRVVQQRDVNQKYFAEGLTEWQGRLIQLTWRESVAFVYDLATFADERTFTYAGEGWGLTHDGTRLILSDGSDTLTFLDPATFQVTGRIAVKDRGAPVARSQRARVRPRRDLRERLADRSHRAHRPGDGRGGRLDRSHRPPLRRPAPDSGRRAERHRLRFRWQSPVCHWQAVAVDLSDRAGPEIVGAAGLRQGFGETGREETVCADCALLFIVLAAAVVTTAAQQTVTKYVRYSLGGATSYGILEGDAIRELKGDLFASPAPTGRRVKLAEVKLLPPCVPSKVIAVGLNYKTHLGERPAAEYPGLFAKYPTSIIATEENIVIPPDANNVHYEGELVVVIGKRAKNVPVADAKSHVFGVTAGNDVSERDWQKQDLQWFRAKASDTFGPHGAGHRHRPQLRRSAARDEAERRGRAVAADEGPASSTSRRSSVTSAGTSRSSPAT